MHKQKLNPFTPPRKEINGQANFPVFWYLLFQQIFLAQVLRSRLATSRLSRFLRKPCAPGCPRRLSHRVSCGHSSGNLLFWRTPRKYVCGPQRCMRVPTNLHARMPPNERCRFEESRPNKGCGVPMHDSTARGYESGVPPRASRSAFKGRRRSNRAFLGNTAAYLLR